MFNVHQKIILWIRKLFLAWNFDSKAIPYLMSTVVVLIRDYKHIQMDKIA